MKEEMVNQSQKKQQKQIKINLVKIFYFLLRLTTYGTLSIFIKNETGYVTAITILFILIYIEVNASATSLLKATNTEQLRILDTIMKWNRKHDILHNGPENFEEHSASNLQG
jgi:hypothetical protein